MINLKFQFKPFIKMAAEHEYYAVGENNELYFLPTPRTAIVLDKMAMMIRVANGALNILFDTSKTELLHQRLLQITEKELKLSFLLFSRNPYFINYTNIPVQVQGKVFYCSNKHLKDKNSGYLHEADALDESQLVSASPEYLKDNESDKNAYSYSLDQGDENIANEILPGHQINCNYLTDGYYRLFANQKELSSFIHLGTKTKNSPIGFVDIFLGGAVKKRLLKAIEVGDIPTFDYKIKFHARSVYWKYNIVLLHAKRMKNLNVACTKGSSKLTFKNLGKSEYNDNRMFSFMSEKPVKYQKQYSHEIQLKKQEGESSGKVLVKKLAFAPFDIIKPLNETDYMSEIYVYI